MRLSQWNKCRAWNNIPRLILRNFNLQLFPRLYIRRPYNIFVSFKSFMRSVNDGQELLGWLIGIINKAWNIEQFPRILKPILKHWNKICLSGNTKYIYIVIYLYRCFIYRVIISCDILFDFCHMSAFINPLYN